MGWHTLTVPATGQHLVYLYRVDDQSGYARPRTYYSFDYGLTWLRSVYEAYLAAVAGGQV